MSDTATNDSDPNAFWELMLDGSEELAEDLGLGDKPGAGAFSPRALEAIDRWVGEHDSALDPEELGLLGMMLARILVETHDGGLVRVEVPGHALEGEWAVTGFRRGLAADYCVPFVVSAARIGVDRAITAKQWYAQLRDEGAR